MRLTLVGLIVVLAGLTALLILLNSRIVQDFQHSTGSVSPNRS